MTARFTVWTTRAGQRIQLVDMATPHLQNALAMLKRARREMVHTCAVVDVMDGPCYDCHDEQIRRAEADGWITAMRAELERRGV